MESPKRFTLGLVMGALPVCGCLAGLLLLFGDFDGTWRRILTTGVLLGLFSFLALPGATLLARRRGSVLAWCCVLLAGLGFLWAAGVVWSGLDDVDAAWRLLVTLAACAAAVSQVCATTARRRERDPAGVDRLYGASNLLAYTLAALVTLACWNELGPGALFWKALAVLAVLDVLAVALQPVLRTRARTT